MDFGIVFPPSLNMSENYWLRSPEVTDKVIAISGPWKFQIFHIRKNPHSNVLRPQTTPKLLLSSLLVLIRISSIVNFPRYRENTWKDSIKSSLRNQSLPEKVNNFSRHANLGGTRCQIPFPNISSQFWENRLINCSVKKNLPWAMGDSMIFHGPPTPAGQGSCDFDKGRSLVVQ